jgi:hypothetical protein
MIVPGRTAASIVEMVLQPARRSTAVEGDRSCALGWSNEAVVDS